MQAKAYADACDSLVSVEVGGDIEAAQQIKYVKIKKIIFFEEAVLPVTIRGKEDLCTYSSKVKKS